MIIYSTDETLVIPIGINPNINYDSSGGDTKTQSKTVNSSTGRQVVLPDEGYDALSKVTVNPYTVERKERMITENGPYEFIPSNADALSSVSVEVLVNPRIEQERTVDSSTETQIVEPEAPYNCLTRVTVNPYVLDSSSAVIEQNGTYAFVPVHDGLSSVTVDVSIDGRSAQTKTVDSSTARQVVEPDSPYNCLSSVTVEPYSLQDKAVNPLKTAQNIIPDSSYDGLGSVTVNAVTSSIDSNIIPGNIKKGVIILGVVGTYEGEQPTPGSSDVNFIDYDGTILHSYTREEALALAALPENPVHEGLTSRGWNVYNLDALKSLVNSFGYLDLGQMYVPSDGNSHINITVPNNNWTLDTMYITTANEPVDIDWGDGSTLTSDASSFTHTYASAGDYVIKIANNNTGSSAYDKTITIYSNEPGNVIERGTFQSAITGVELADYTKASLPYCRNLEYITFSNIVGSELVGPDGHIPTFGLYYCTSLKSLTIPFVDYNGFITEGYAFSGCTSLDTISATSLHIKPRSFSELNSLKRITGNISLTGTTYGDPAVRNCPALELISGSFNINYGSIENCSSLDYVKISQNWLVVNTIDGCASLATLDLSNVNYMEAGCFNNCPSLTDVILPYTPPTIEGDIFSGTTDINNITLHIKPNTLSAYESAQYWSDYSGQFVEDL